LRGESDAPAHDQLSCRAISATGRRITCGRVAVTTAGSDTVANTGSTLRPDLTRLLSDNLPRLRVAISGSLLWAAAMSGGACAGLLARGWQTPGNIGIVTALYALGAAIAFAPALTVAGIVGGRRPGARFCAAMLALTLGTIVATALIFAVQYRIYYAQWHGEAFSKLWVIQMAFTVGGAIGQFAISGVRLYFPVGFVAAILVSAWFAHRRD
jgi:hypothetical protein